MRTAGLSALADRDEFTSFARGAIFPSAKGESDWQSDFEHIAHAVFPSVVCAAQFLEGAVRVGIHVMDTRSNSQGEVPAARGKLETDATRTAAIRRAQTRY